MYCLLAVIQGRPRSFPLAEGTIAIGRGEENDVVIADPSLSRLHARITVDGDRLFVQDMGSSHGTWIDGSPAVGLTPSHPGARI